MRLQEDGVLPKNLHCQGEDALLTAPSAASNLSGSDPQARGAINSSYSQSLSGIVFALLCYLGAEIPMNEGFVSSH